jgi:class 3 adenylate cyclase/pimeloyl-ACP methyl ester carboxylesterase
MTTPVRYCTSQDGVRLAFSAEGHGPPLLWSPLIFESLAKEAATPVIHAFLMQLRQCFRVIRFDQRGTGLSQRDITDFSPATAQMDLEAVLSAAHADRVHLLANPGWTTHFLIYAAGHPARVASLTAWNGQTSMEEAMPDGVYESMLQMVRANWALASRTLADFGGRLLGDEPLRLATACKESASGATVASILAANRCVSAASHLPNVTSPVLLFVNDGMLPGGTEAAQRLAAALPHSRLVVLDSSEYVLHPSALGRALDIIINFAAEADPSVRLPHVHEPSSAGTRTILFTDLVGHTEMMRLLGDERGRDVLREHERITRDLLRQHGGVEVKTMGDGFMASFTSVMKAMDCAIALQRAFASWNDGPGAQQAAPLQVRVGLNAGEPIEEDGDLFGSTVIMASRVAAQAGAGEILIPEPLRHLLSGKSYVYADRGEAMLKGFEDAVRLYEVRWREPS